MTIRELYKIAEEEGALDLPVTGEWRIGGPGRDTTYVATIAGRGVMARWLPEYDNLGFVEAFRIGFTDKKYEY
jgi:hypothetical protein